MFHAERPQSAAAQALLAHTSISTPPNGEFIAPDRAAFYKNSDLSGNSPPFTIEAVTREQGFTVARAENSVAITPAICLEGISKAFEGHEVLRDVSLEVAVGSIHGIVGKSGAGKTTLIRIAGLLESPDHGSVYYKEVEAPPCGLHGLRGRELLEARRSAGFVFQSFNLFDSRSAAENVAFPLEAAGWPRAEIKARVAELLEVVGLTDKAERPAARLSGGEKQRVALARALANRPSILFSDEATSALDPETTRSVLDLIRSLRDRYGLTVVMVTHQMEVVRRICDSVSFISGGCIVEEGSVAEVFANPRSEEAKAFLREDRHD